MITMNFKNKNKTITQIVPATKSNIWSIYLSDSFFCFFFFICFLGGLGVQVASSLSLQKNINAG